MQTPRWAIKARLEELDIKDGFGTGGIDPFKMYTHPKYRESALSYYMRLNGFDRDLWMERNGGTGWQSGSDLLVWSRDRLGPDMFEQLAEYQKQVRASNLFWESIRERAAPTLINIFKQPKIVGLVIAAVLILIGLPVVIWNSSRAIFAWIFVRRPTILGPKDSDIYRNFFKRIFWRFPKLPKVIVNDDLDKKLSSLIETNKLITKKNKGGLFRKAERTPYPHIIAYGEAGVGKTLFAKNLAKESNMHFMYMTVSDLSQLAEEEALETLKNFFAYARKFAPCVLIIDEADRLFAGEDIKSKKLMTLFQREFSKAVDENIQLFLITNYPSKFPDPILNRISKRLYFDNPNYSSQLKLLQLHLEIAQKRQKKDIISLKTLKRELSENLLKGLVGRDIESIAISFSLRENQGMKILIEEIETYNLGKKEMEAFKEAQKNKSILTSSSSQDSKAKPKTTRKKPKRFFE